MLWRVNMVKVVFTYNVPGEKREDYLKSTAEVIKPYWESHGCKSYTVWQADDESCYRKEMLFESEQARNESIGMQRNDPKAKEVVGLFGQYAVNTQRKTYIKRV